MSSKYQIVEPHPSAASTRIHSGRGGAGNKVALPPNTTRGSDATGPASRASLSHSTTSTSSRSTSSSTSQHQTSSGRGGAGNFHAQSERAIFSFDEELERQLRRDSAHPAPVYHCGRGGAGNVSFQRPGSSDVYIDGSVRQKRDADTASANSTSSVESGADVATRNLKRGLQKGWGRVVGVGSYMTG